MMTNGDSGTGKPRKKIPVSTRNRPVKIRPNRIFELTQQRHWTYEDVAERVRILAEERGDKSRLKVHGITINRLATGSMELTQKWMDLLSDVYHVPNVEIIAPPLAQGMRRVRVMGTLKAGAWAEQHQWPESEQFDIMVPDDPTLRELDLYAGEIAGTSMNRRYPEGSIAILSRIANSFNGDIAKGRRYHVRSTHADGTSEETIKTLDQDDAGKYWLKPESNDPMHQAWIPLDGEPGTTVELIGRVRGVYLRESD